MTKVRALLIKYFEVIRISAALAIAFSFIALLVFFFSGDPGSVCYWFLAGPVSSFRRFGGVIELAIPFVICGMAMTMMFAVNEVNLSVDGIFYVCMGITSIICLKIGLPMASRPLAALVLSGVVGGFIALIPAVLRVKFQASIVVCSLMLNYILQYIGRLILMYVVRNPTLTYNGSDMFDDQASLAVIVPKTRIHQGLYVAIFIVVIVYYLLKKTKLGMSIRLTGKNRAFAKYCGIAVVPTILVSQFIGGALAGMGGAVEVMGIYRQFRVDTLLGYGFDGMLIAVVGKKSPVGVVIASLALAYLRQGAALINSNTDIPIEVVQVLQGMVVIFCAADMLLSGLKQRMVVKNAEMSLERKGSPC